MATGLTGGAIVPPAHAANDRGIDGWTISRGDQAEICEASGPSDGQAKLSLVAEGPLFLLFIDAPDFPKGKAAYTVSLAFDGKDAVSAAALGKDGVMAINVGRGDSAKTLVSASSVLVGVEGRTHSFSLRNVAGALDAVARCAGQPTLSEQVDEPPQPIAGAGDWQLSVTMPGSPGRPCSARIAGDQVDVLMLLNKDGELVLLGGHKDWATWGGDVPLKLAIDDAQPVTMTAHTVNNLIAVLVKDPALLRRLRNARTLDWMIPTGHVRGDVSGLGVALDAMKACKAEGASKR